MDIIDVENGYYEAAVDFLKSITNIYDVDLTIVENACVVVEEEEIIGILSFEKFSSIGLIRYFVFKKIIEENIVNALLTAVSKKASLRGVKTLITLVNKTDVILLFKSLGFVDCNKQRLFIDETGILDTKFKDSYVLQLEIDKYLKNIELIPEEI